MVFFIETCILKRNGGRLDCQAFSIVTAIRWKIELKHSLPCSYCHPNQVLSEASQPYKAAGLPAIDMSTLWSITITQPWSELTIPPVPHAKDSFQVWNILRLSPWLHLHAVSNTAWFRIKSWLVGMKGRQWIFFFYWNWNLENIEKSKDLKKGLCFPSNMYSASIKKDPFHFWFCFCCQCQE